MIRSLLSPVVLLLAIGSTLLAKTPTHWNGSSTIQFSGTSTLHSWSGKVATEPFVTTVVMDENDKPESLKSRVEVKAASMNTAEPKRDDNMHDDMKVASYPLICAVMDASFAQVICRGKAPTRLPFTLTIMGKPLSVDGQISNWLLKGNTATFDLDFELSLKKCDIKVPSVLFVISVGDTIKIHAPVKLVRATN